ncbi:MAG: hypothetical protein AAB647_01670 [Patescibacteria group bacterium]
MEKYKEQFQRLPVWQQIIAAVVIVALIVTVAVAAVEIIIPVVIMLIILFLIFGNVSVSKSADADKTTWQVKSDVINADVTHKQEDGLHGSIKIPPKKDEE